MENIRHPADFMLPLELQDPLEPYGPQFYQESVDPYQPQARAEVSTCQLTIGFLSLKGRLHTIPGQGEFGQ